MRKFKLSTQLIILFSTVTLFSSLVFGLISYRNYQTVYMGLAKNEISTYIETIKYQPREVDNKSYLGYIDFIVKREGLFKVNLVGQPIYSDNVKEMTNNNEAIMLEILEKGYAGDQFEIHTKDKQTFYVLIRSVSKNPITQEDRYIIGVMDDAYINALKGTTAQEDVLLTFYGTFVAFAIITLIGNITLVLWSRFVANRVKKIKNEVSHFTSSGYQNELRLEGNDEIKELADAVESLRIEILRNEKTKQEMFQNLSHDLKTPISVISSYAEAIRDGITDISDAQIIMKQADKLQQKVKMMLDINKLEYISDKSDYEDIALKSVIQNVVNNNRLRLQAFDVILDLDDSTFKGIKENYHTVVENIIDNAIRYAKSTLIIKLKNKELSFYNDGPDIEEKYIESLFKPYEKGSKGQFGLGMSIVQKTVNTFGLTLTVKNANPGVVFIIKEQ